MISLIFYKLLILMNNHSNNLHSLNFSPDLPVKTAGHGSTNKNELLSFDTEDFFP